MPVTKKHARRAVQQWLTDCRAFFRGARQANGERNWRMLRLMSLVYLVFLGIYLLAVCPALNLPLQTSAVRVFAAVHAAFTLWVLLPRKKQPPVRAVELAIILFAAQILGLSGFLDVAVFSAGAPFLFPLCLVLMTQVYTQNPVCTILEVLLPSAAYLVCCRLTRDTHAFLLDAVGISVAAAISGAALYSITNYKMRAYHAQLALQKMCALDPMTGVNNKSTFEFLVEDYLRSCPPGGHAMAVCDFDDFKQINDLHGHRMGDEVLNAFAGQLHRLVDKDPSLLAGRFGGDEFVLFVRQYGAEQDVLDKLGVLCTVPGFDFPVTCSIGVAFSHSGNAAFGQYFSAADRSLYRAKDASGGSICTADADAAADGAPLRPDA